MIRRTQSQISPAALTLLVLLLLLSAWIGIRGLNADSLWIDEYVSLYQAGGAHYGPLDVIGVWNRVDVWHPPLYSILLNRWGTLVGWSEFAARSMSFFIGMIGIAATYRLGRKLFSPVVGMAAAVVVGTSAYALNFFHDIRSYTLYLIFTPIMALAYVRLLLNKKTGISGYVFLFGAIVGALYTHYLAALTAVAIGLFHLCALPFGVFKGRMRLWWSINGVFAASLIAFVPWLSILIAGLADAEAQSGARGAGAFTPYAAVQGVLFMFSNGSVALLILLFAVTVAPPRRRTIIVWLWFLLVTGLLLLINARFGVLLEVRYMFVLWTPLALLAGVGIERIYAQRRLWGVGLLILWGIGGVWSSLDRTAAGTISNPHFHLPWRELRAELVPRVSEGDSVVFLLPDWTWDVYHNGTREYYLHDLPVQSAVIDQPLHFGITHYEEQVQQALGDATRAWIAYDPSQPFSHFNFAARVLSALSFQQCTTVTQNDALTLYLYGRMSEQAGVIRFEDGAVEVSALTPLPDIVSGTLNLSHYFVTSDVEWAGHHSIAFHVENAQGELVMQTDYGLPFAPEGCRMVDLSLENLPVGEYTLLMTVYNWETGERASPNAAEGLTLTPDQRVVLGTIQLAH